MALYAEIEPHESGMLETGDGNRLYWEVCGSPSGKPAVVLHGGPGSGCTPGWRRYFDPAAYRIVLFDQRGCGRSTPHASDPAVGLESQTTAHQIADIELLRAELGIERWLVLGGSWGSELGLAYAEQHPGSVSEMVLFSVATATRRDVEWITRDVGRLVPEAWARFRDAVPAGERDGSLVDAYAPARKPDRGTREGRRRLVRVGGRPCRDRVGAAAEPTLRRPGVSHVLRPPGYALLATRRLARGWAARPGRGSARGHPGVLIHGRMDISSPPDTAWELARAWPDAELVLIDGAGHGTSDAGMAEAVVAATDRFATRM